MANYALPMCPYCFDKKQVRAHLEDGIRRESTVTLVCGKCRRTWAEQLTPDVLEHLWRAAKESNS
jgi:hypothetical protein